MATTTKTVGQVLIACDGRMDALGRCMKCGQAVSSTTGAHSRPVSVVIPEAGRTLVIVAAAELAALRELEAACRRPDLSIGEIQDALDAIDAARKGGR